jgi:hypothetical protein
MAGAGPPGGGETSGGVVGGCSCAIDPPGGGDPLSVSQIGFLLAAAGLCLARRRSPRRRR